MYYNDDLRQGYYCDQCDAGCCSSHWILCESCMQELRMRVFMAETKMNEMTKEISDLKDEIKYSQTVNTLIGG